MKEIGDILKELRKEKGRTQEEITTEMNSLFNININKGMISKWESNKSEPIFKYVKLFSVYYGVSVDYLLGLSKFKNNNEEIKSNDKNTNLSREETTLLENFNKLNDLGKKEANKRVAELTEINRYLKDTTDEISSTKDDTEEYTLAAHDDGLDEETKQRTLNKVKEIFKQMDEE